MFSRDLRPFEEFEWVEAASLGVAVFSAGLPILTSGKLSSSSDTASYMRESTARNKPFTRTTVQFKISAYHPFYTPQQFWFRLSFEHNGNDIRNAAIRVLEDKSSRMITSEFRIEFKAIANSYNRDPVAEIMFNIIGGWDPGGPGISSFSGNLLIRGDGQYDTNVMIISERNWVKFEGFSELQRTPVVPSSPLPNPAGSSAVLRRGAQGPKVTELQRRLNSWLAKQKKALLIPDGVFGPRTVGVVLAFQKAVGINPDGVVGPQTWARLPSA